MEVTVHNSCLVAPESGVDMNHHHRSKRVLLSGFSQFMWFVPYRTRFLFYRRPVDESLTFDRIIANLKSALAKTLVDFYPLAGRLVVREDGLMEVDYNGQGVLFMEASANVSLQELEQRDSNFEIPQELLLDLEQTGGHVLKWPWKLDSPLFIIQVTRFLCGGICISLKYNHQVLDGTGNWHFVQSWAEVCCGKSISLKPIVIDNLQDILVTPDEHLEPPPGFVRLKLSDLAKTFISDSTNFNMSCFTFKKGMVLKLKQQHPGFTKFQLLTGHIWRRVTLARKLQEHEETVMHFPVNLRGRLESIPQGYCGMGMMVMSTRRISVKELLSSEIFGAKLIRERILEFSEQGARSMAKLGMSSIENDYANFVNMSVSHDVNMGSSLYFPVYQDFGFGKPIGMTINPVLTGGKVFYFPGREEGDVVAYISLQVEAMQRLKADEMFESLN